MFDIDLSRPSRQAISINYETINGTAKQGQDFVGTSGTLVLAPGQTHASVSVAIKADLAREQSETFSLRLIPPFSSDIATNTIGVIGTATIDDSSIVGTSGGDSLQGTKAADAMFGDGGDDFLFGLNGNDVLFGGGGNDTIDGGKGRDSMRGGGGNDRYTIDRNSDRIVEAHNAGTDTVSSPVDFTLPKNVENLILTGSKDLAGIGNDLGNKLTGNKGDNRLEGLAGNDTLNGGKGRDTMIGGPGNDTYVLDTRGDHIVEQAGGGTDTVKVSFDYTLANRFENLTLLGKGRLDGNGNAADNVIHGNRGANELKGLDGDDRLIGGGGNDRMIGGSGNDTYVVDGKGDRVIETGGGHDRIETSVDYRLPGHVEDITAIGRKGIDITGNGDANRLTGNRAPTCSTAARAPTRWPAATATTPTSSTAAAIRSRRAPTAAPTPSRARSPTSCPATSRHLVLTGRGDHFGIGNGHRNRLTGNDGNNRLDGGDGNDVLKGGGGNDRLIGGRGHDTMTGDGGRDIFAFRSKAEADGNHITDFQHRTDRIDLSDFDANSRAHGTQSFKLVDYFTGHAGQLRAAYYGSVQGDIDGDGYADFTITLDNTYVTLGHGDFIL